MEAPKGARQTADKRRCPICLHSKLSSPMAKSALRRRRGKPRKPIQRLSQADRKRQLLAQAKQLFLTLGYHATTTEKIAQAAGVTEPVLYQHFDDKKALFLAVLRDIRVKTLEHWQAEMAGHTDPRAKLQAIAR